MSKAVKKIVKSVKKVFKKIVKVVKKIVSSKLFKAVAIAAAIYFTAGAAIGAAGSAGASATAAGSTAAAGTTAATTAAAAGSVPVGATIAAGQTAAATSGSLLGSIGQGVVAAGKAAGGWMAANPTLTSTALNTAGTIMSNIAAGKAEEEALKKQKAEEEKNANTHLPVYARATQAYQNAGFAAQNVEAKPAHFYNSANNNWQPVSGSKKQTPLEKLAASRGTA